MAVTSKYPLPPPNKKDWPWDVEESISSYDTNVSWPKISIVTPSYNQGEFIEETIRSILLQNYPNLEYIIIDGGSTDNTVEVIKKYSNWITYWVSEKDNGQSHAINKGIDKCTGDIFNWLNSDDWYDKGSLHAIGEAFIKSDCHVVYGKERWVYHDSKNAPVIRKGTTVCDNLAHSIYEGHIDQPSTFWSFPVIQQLKPVNENLHYLMDADLWIRYLLKFGQEKTYFIDRIFVNFRFHGTSKSTTMIKHFEMERWSIRYALLSDSDNAAHIRHAIGSVRKNIFLTYENCQPHHKTWQDLSSVDLLKKFYEINDIPNFKKIYWHTLLNVKGHQKILIKYFYRFLLPTFLLNKVRALRARTND